MNRNEHEMKKVQSKDHNIGSYTINKIYLSSYNDKKYILKDRAVKSFFMVGGGA